MLTKLLRPMAAALLLLIITLPALHAYGDQGDYQPYKPPASAEQVSAPLFVVLAYSLIWIVLLGFVVSVWRRQDRVMVELEQLERQIRGER